MNKSGGKGKRAPAKPWDQENPKANGQHERLSPQAKASAQTAREGCRTPLPEPRGQHARRGGQQEMKANKNSASKTKPPGQRAGRSLCAMKATLIKVLMADKTSDFDHRIAQCEISALRLA